ncbi:MAG TPA: ferritin-like domain-containing protein [Candidatus Baltobacteraceae bacterium]|nr:ferritin-like domain-containing protein [Candidatus Baltobacteraceae bacterium]
MERSLLERQQEIYDWYAKEPRFLSKTYLDSIPWHEVRNHEIKPELIGVMYYMRDVEKLTDVYFAELQKTPTGKNAPIQAFMERWRTEESLHGDLMNRFLEEAGYPSDEKWFDKVKASIPFSNRLHTAVTQPLLTIGFGRDFSAVHMTWGAINEYSTMNGYSRLREMARHPVLDRMLDGIMREESRHAQYYWRTAKTMLDDSPYRQKLARFFIDRFWTPVGEGSKPRRDTAMVVRTLFGGDEGLRKFDGSVSSIIRRLPGFEDCSTVTDVTADFAAA